MGFIRTNWQARLPAALESVIREDSIIILSSAGYAFDSTGGYGALSHTWFEGISAPGVAASLKGDVNDSTMQWAGFGVASFDGSVFYVTAFGIHHATGLITMTAFYAVDAYTVSANPCSASGRILWKAIVGSR